MIGAYLKANQKEESHGQCFAARGFSILAAAISTSLGRGRIRIAQGRRGLA